MAVYGSESYRLGVPIERGLEKFLLDFLRHSEATGLGPVHVELVAWDGAVLHYPDGTHGEVYRTSGGLYTFGG